VIFSVYSPVTSVVSSLSYNGGYFMERMSIEARPVASQQRSDVICLAAVSFQICRGSATDSGPDWKFS
jgi:hypothetical protein